jgi:hypothetical protein
MKRSRRAIASVGAGLQKINPEVAEEFIRLSLGGSVEGEEQYCYPSLLLASLNPHGH